LRFCWDLGNISRPNFCNTPAAIFLPYSPTTTIYHDVATHTAYLTVKDLGAAVANFSTTVNVKPFTANIQGWLWAGSGREVFGVPTSSYGWISLNCENVFYDVNPSGILQNYCNPSPPGVSYGLNYTSGSPGTINGWVWSPNTGWICFGTSCNPYGNPPNGNIAIQVADGNPDPGLITSGWGNIINLGSNGWLQINCGSDPLRPTSTCMRVNMASSTITGYAWNGYREGGTDYRGVGWILATSTNVTFMNRPWLETQFGLIHGQQKIKSDFGPPPGEFNATYCIRGTEITNFKSQSGCLEQITENLTFPSQSDFNRILRGYNKVSIDNTGDSLVNTLNTYGTPASFGNNVYDVTNCPGGECNINVAGLALRNATGPLSSGAGTIVINGDLNISSDITYATNPTLDTKIENLASVAWIVKGDVIIASGVKEIAGNFIVLGNGTACVPNNNTANHCGAFFTGGEDAAKQLTVNGLVMARKFVLQRKYVRTGEPSEKFVFDGRSIVNPPPGLGDLIKGLPIWRESSAIKQIQ
jgi:hypothetical protein